MKKRLLCLTTAVILACSMAGCGDVKDDSSAVDSTAAAAVNTESVETPPELPEIEPVPVPEGGWTEETIQDVIYINGNNVHLPCKFEEFGHGFEISIDEYTNIHEEHNYIFTPFKYNNIMIGTMNVANCTDYDSLKSGDVVCFTCDSDILEDGSDNRVPISINGVSLGSSKEDVEKYLGFEMTEVVKDSDYSSYVQMGNLSISLKIEEGILNMIMIAYHIS